MNCTRFGQINKKRGLRSAWRQDYPQTSHQTRREKYTSEAVGLREATLHLETEKDSQTEACETENNHFKEANGKK